MHRPVYVAIFCAVFLACTAVALNDYGYCGRRSRHHEFYQTLGTVATAIDIGQWGLLITDDTTTKIHRLGPEGDITGGSEWLLSGPPFCIPVQGRIHIADVNGDGKDDLICQKIDKTLSVRYFQPHDYLQEEPIAEGFTCDPAAATDSLYFGDFDGNRAEDLLCVNAARDVYTIYFNAACDPKNRNRVIHGSYGEFKSSKTWNHFGVKHYSNGNHNHEDVHLISRSCNSQSLPVMHFLSGTLPCAANPADDIAIADVNGDKMSDIVCHDSGTDEISVTISNRKVSSTIFDTGSVSTSAGTACSHADATLRAVDVDGDGDQDIFCSINDATTPGNIHRIAYAAGYDLLQFEPYSPDRCWQYCATSAGSPSHISVGDFDGDGRDDLLCRISESALISTSIMYSQRRPTL